MNIEVQWCAYNFVERDILTLELCKEIDKMFEGNCDLQTFAQTILENGICDDVELVQQFMDEAFTLAKSGASPPTNYFRDSENQIIPKEKEKPAMEAVESTPPAYTPGEASWKHLPDLTKIKSLPDPGVKETMISLLMSLKELRVSDLHLSTDSVPFARINLEIRKFGNSPLTAKEALKLNTILLTEDQKTEFSESGDLDFALALDESNRFRVNLMMHKGGVAGTYRMVPNTLKSLEELGFPNPEIIYKLLDYHNGLILVTGAVGSGKTTTLAALIHAINQKRYDHVITVEDPIEIVQKSKNCNITQRQVGKHTISFASALKGALREDPDIIVIGELRDLETIEMAITASETGHLVIGTLHTNDAASTLNRLLDVFPPAQQQQIRSMTAESLKGIICQKLIPSVDGGLAIALEILINNTAVASNIRENKTHQIKQIIETGSKKGMCIMDQSVFNLFESEKISEEQALANLEDNSFKKRIMGKKFDPALVVDPPEDKKKPKKKGLFR